MRLPADERGCSWGRGLGKEPCDLLYHNNNDGAPIRGRGRMMILRLSLELPQDGTYVRITRSLGRTLLEHLRVVPENIDDIELVVGELCTNVIRHAAGDATAGRYCVILEYYPDRVAVTVEDHGQGFSPRDVAPPGSTRPDVLTGGERIGGYGLKVVEALTDRLEFHKVNESGTAVKAEKMLVYASPADARAAARLGGTDDLLPSACER
jgi:serine/threonine-protein kinase RsbW